MPDPVTPAPAATTPTTASLNVVVDPPAPVADPPAPAGDPPAPVVTDDEALRPEGKKALDAWKARAKAAEDALAEAQRAQLSDHERALVDARREAGEAATAAANEANVSRLFRAELRAASATKLNEQAIKDLLVDSTAAMRLLGLDEVPVTSDGDLDSEAISQAVASYVEARPFLAASATLGPGGIDQGARQTTAAIKTLAEQIAEAEAAGNWKLSSRLKTQSLLAGAAG
jgi:hypothetical protein